MSAARPVPRSLAVHPEESLAGYILNTAARLRTTPAETARRFGLVPAGREPRLEFSYAILLPERHRQTLASTCRATIPEVDGLTLARWSGVLLQGAAAREAPTSYAGRAWVLPPTTRACPRCLPRGALGPYATWRTRWTLPWSFACVRHGTLLLDRCPACATQLGLAVRENGYRRAQPGLISSMSTLGLHPAACRARVPSPGRQRSVVCGQRLDGDEMPAWTAAAAVLAAQARIDGLLDGDGEERLSLGTCVDDAQYLRDLRLIAFALRVTNPDSWPFSPPEGTATALQAAEQDLVQGPPMASGRRNGQPRRLWTEPPNEVAATAAIITTAVRVLNSASTTDARNVLRPLVEAAAAAEPRLWARVRVTGRPSARLARFTSSRHGGLTSSHVLARSVPHPPPGLNGNHVPQLASVEADALIAPLAPDTSARERRRVIALALHRLVTGGDLADAAAELGLPLMGASSTVARVGARLRSAGNEDAFWEALPLLVDRLALHRTNWGGRRRALDAWQLPDDDWDQLQVRLRAVGGQSTNASSSFRRNVVQALVWAVATSGDLVLSPQARNLNSVERSSLFGAAHQLSRRQPKQADVISRYAASLTLLVDGQSADG